MIDLIEKHKHEIKFKLKLMHKSTRLYIGNGGLTNTNRYASFLECNHKGMEVSQVFADFAVHEDWLSKLSPEDFVIESELA
jgi:hypothetical protein